MSMRTSLLLCTFLVLLFSAANARLRDHFERLQRHHPVHAPPTDFDVYPFHPSKKNNLMTRNVVGNYTSTGRPYSAWFASFHPSAFSFLAAAEDGCTALEKTSVSAVDSWHEYCEYATNGGFFNMGGPVNGTYCIGNLISQGKVVQLPTTGPGYTRTQFGVTSDHRMVAGIMDAGTVAELNFVELMTGFGWVVRHGQSYVNSTHDITQPAANQGFVTEKAPRTAVGVLNDGRMGLLEIDGEEDIKYGPDLYELAELAIELGFDTVVNIDGGGSAVSVKGGSVISVPTCNDTPVMCERADASLTCVRRNAHSED